MQFSFVYGHEKSLVGILFCFLVGILFVQSLLVQLSVFHVVLIIRCTDGAAIQITVSYKIRSICLVLFAHFFHCLWSGCADCTGGMALINVAVVGLLHAY